MCPRVRGAMLFAAVLGGFAPRVAVACSMSSAFATARRENVAFLIGTGAGDTVRAGVGTVRYRVAPGHSGPAGDRAIFGQVVNVERVTGIDTLRLPASTRRVILVPWDYGADCTPTPFMRSARWLSTESRGLYDGVLRERSQWVDGVPTLDVFTPDHQPYPGRSPRFLGAPVETMLSLDELFPLLTLLPDARLLQDSAEQAIAPLMAWARANPATARRAPMAGAISFANYMARIARVRRVNVPVLGTYRVQVDIPANGRREFFVRTEAKPDGEWHVTRSASPPPDPTVIPPAEGYTILAVTGRSASALPTGCDDRTMDQEGYLYVMAQPAETGPAGVMWQGMIEFNLLARALPRDSALLQPFARAWNDEYTRRYRAQLPDEAPAQFTLPAGAPMRVQTDFVAADGRRLQLRGERVSTDVTRCLSDPQRL